MQRRSLAPSPPASLPRTDEGGERVSHSPSPVSLSGRERAGTLAALARRAAPLAYLLPALLVYALFVLWPLGRVAALSLVQWDGLSAPAFVGLGNYATLWADPGFADELRHSAIWLAVTLAVPVVVGLLLALLLDAVPAWARGPARALLLVPLLLPAVVIAVAWRLLYNPLSGPIVEALNAVGLGGLAGDYLGDPHLALGALLVPACWASFGLSMLVFGAALRGIGPEIVAATRVDGAGAWARLRHITLPLLRGSLPLAVVVTALCAVPALDLLLLTTNGGPGYATTTLTLDMYGRAFGGGQVGAGAALATMQLVVGLALALLALGVARGAVGASDDGDAARPAPPSRLSLGRLSAVAGLALVTALTVFPLLWLVVLAVQPRFASENISPWTALWANLGAVWSLDFGAAFFTSAVAAVVVAVATVALALPAAFALATARRRPVAGAILALLAMGLFQPEAILIIPLFDELKDLGLLSSPLGLVLPEVARTLSFAMLLLWAALRALPRDVLAAAAVDGAAPRHALWRICLPLARPALVVVALWAFLASWNEYLLPAVVLQGGAVQTVPAALGHFVGRVDTLYGLLAAGALLAVVPLLLLYGLLYGALALGLRLLRPSLPSSG